MGSYRLNAAGGQELLASDITQKPLQRLAEDILGDAKDNVIAMGAVDTGKLLSSGDVEDLTLGKRIKFAANYAAYVHEGESTSRDKGPRPFLANAAFRDRGRLDS